MVWTPGHGWKGYELGFVCLSFRLSVFLSRTFLRIGSFFFGDQHDVRSSCGALCITGPDFSKKIFLPQIWGKWTKNRSFLNLLKILVIKSLIKVAV